ncbi:unnamed protein product, partial [Iphiclides podalirius]
MSPTLSFIVILLICDLFSASQGSPIDVCLGGAKFCHRALQKLRWIWPKPWNWPRPKPPPNKPSPNKPSPNKPPKPKPDMPDIADVPPPSYEEY